MVFRFMLIAVICFISPVVGIAFTDPPPGSTLSANGEHQFSWTFTALDPAAMQIGLFDPSTSSFTLIAVVQVVSGNLFISLTLPVGNNLILQSTTVGNSSDVLAESRPYTVASGDNPFNLQTVNGSTSVPAGTSISVFTGPGGRGLIPISTITDALLTTSVPTTALVVSSAMKNTTSVLVLTSTMTLYADLASVTSVGSVAVPGTVLPSPSPFPLDSGEIPLVVHTVLLGPPIASFRKWKRVADQSSVSLGAVTISGTRGQSPTAQTPGGTTITPGTAGTAGTAGTTSPTSTSIPGETTIPPSVTTKKVIPPPITVTASASTSVLTLPPTIVTVYVSVNNTAPKFSPGPPLETVTKEPGVITTSLLPPPKKPSIFPANETTPKMITTGQLCAICTSGLINAGNATGVGFLFLWAWIALVVLVVTKYL